MENIDENAVTRVIVPADQLAALISQNAELKKDLGILISTLSGLTTMFSGKTSIISMAPTIMKLINDPGTAEKFTHIIPIIEKYGKEKAGE